MAQVELAELATGKTLALSSELEFEEWLDAVVKLIKAEAALPWLIGDLLNLGEERFGRHIYQEVEAALERAGYRRRRSTLYGWAWCAARIPTLRRRKNVSWAAHREVAAVEDPELQERLLERAAVEQLGVRELRALAVWPQRVLDGPREGDRWQLLHCDVRDLAEQVPAASGHALITDPPYRDISAYRALSETASKLLAPGGVAAVLTNVTRLPQVLEALATHLRFFWVIAYDIGGPVGNTGGRPFLRAWKPLLLYTRDDPVKFSGRWFHGVDVIRSGPLRRQHHPHEQAVAGMRRVVELLTREGEVVIDPFAGSGSIGLATIQTGRRYIGGDVDDDALRVAAERLREAEVQDCAGTENADQPAPSKARTPIKEVRPST